MTVQELIEELQKVEDKTVAVVYDDAENGDMYVLQVSTERFFDDLLPSHPSGKPRSTEEKVVRLLGHGVNISPRG